MDSRLAFELADKLGHQVLGASFQGLWANMRDFAYNMGRDLNVVDPSFEHCFDWDKYTQELSIYYIEIEIDFDQLDEADTEDLDPAMDGVTMIWRR